MADGINNELEFEKLIKDMADRQLLEFVARQSYDICQQVASDNKRIKDLENGDKKQASIIGGISGTLTAIIIGVINYFMNKRT